MLGHHHSGTGGDKCRRGRDIKGVCPVASRAGSVNRHTPRGRMDEGGFIPHHSGTAGDFFNRLTFHAQTHNERSNLRRGGIAFHDLCHHRYGFGFGQVAAAPRPPQYLP